MITFNFEKIIHTAAGILNLNLQGELSKATFTSVYGDSGSGKTTILRILAGLQSPDKGIIRVNQTDWCDTEKSLFLSVQKRKVGYVSQKYMLFPSMTIRQNLEYAKQSSHSNYDIKKLLEIIELKQLQHKKAAQLSGGQQQRVAFARALVQRPELLLLDEPFAALDSKMRNKMHLFLKAFQKENLTTIFMASHDSEEVCKLSDKVMLLDQGRIINEAPPLELLMHPLSEKTHILRGKVLKIIDRGHVVLQIGENCITCRLDLSKNIEYQIGDIVFWNTIENQIVT